MTTFDTVEQEHPSLAPAGMTLNERGIFFHVQCHGCGNEAHIVRTASPAPAYAMFFMSVAQTVNSLPRGLADADGIADSVRLALEAMASFVPEDGPHPATETPPAPPATAEGPIDAVWVTVGELIGGRPLPPHPETGAPACGVAFEATEADYCAHHLLVELAGSEPLPELPTHAMGAVLYRVPISCVDCAAEAV